MIKTGLLQDALMSRRMWFGLFPMLFFGIGLAIIFHSQAFYQRTTDPEYFHLLNGINIALFNLATPYTAHPGTPLQIIVALASWPVSVVLPGSLVQNVVDNPELFLRSAIILKIFIISMVILFAGLRIFEHTRNIWLSLLLQLLPLGNAYTLTVIGRLNPESLMIVPVILLSAMLISILYQNTNKGISSRQIKQLAIIGGLGMAIKFSYFPFLLIPFFLLKSFKEMSRYILFTIFFTLVFAFPIIFNFSDSFAWFGKMLVNSGQWGGGNSTFIDWSMVPERLYLLMNFNLMFPILLFVLGAVMLFVWLTHNAKNQDFKTLNLISAGVLAGVVLSVFLITKHFAYRYYITTLFFQVVLFYLITEYARRLFRVRVPKNMLPVIAFTIYFTIVVWQMFDFRQKMEITLEGQRTYALRSDTVNISRQENIPLIVSSFYAGCPFPEFSLNEGYMLCGNLKSTFSEELRKKYPLTSMYVDWSDHFYHWNLFMDARDFVVPEQGLNVFIGQGKEPDLVVILERLKFSFPEYIPQVELIQHFDHPEEYFYKISFSDNPHILR
ncbi:MAG: hypothetical protein K9H16_07300 [Bacteroidales bacterium]|nr:hypothetical protein [Bacteroidales bacterium]